METEILDFKVTCAICKREIVDGMLFYEHPKHGYVCECCSQFNDGDIKLITDEDE